MRDFDPLLVLTDAGALSTAPIAMRQRNLAVLFALGSMSSIQLGAALSDSLFDRLGAAGVVFLRLLFAAVVLCAAVRPRWTGRSRRERVVVLALGVTSGLMTLCFYEALSRIPQGILVAIEFTGPLTVAFVGSRRPADLVWVGLAAAGIAVLTLGHPVHGTVDSIGIVFAFAAAAGWGTYIVLTKRVGQTWPGLSGLAISMAVAALVSMPFGLSHFAHRYGDLRTDLYGLALGLLVPLAPYVLELAALRRLPTRVFGVLMSLEPGLGALFGWVIVGQSLTFAGVVAIALVVSASAGVTLTSSGDAVPVVIE